MADPTAHEAAEILEDNAQGRIKAIFDDIRSGLRVPYVDLVFRSLASRYPDYLDLAWRQVHPNAQTVFFETQADWIRRRALQAVSDAGVGSSPVNTDAAEVVRVLHYAGPKHFLVVAAWRAALTGQEPRLQELPTDLKRQLVPGVPAGAVNPFALVDAPTGNEPDAILSEIDSALGLPISRSAYSALVRWPEVLRAAWTALEPRLAEPSWRGAERDLRRMAASAIEAFPFRMDATPHSLRHAGLTELDLDAVRELLTGYYRAFPVLLALSSAAASHVLGAERAAESPFPTERAQPGELAVSR